MSALCFGSLLQLCLRKFYSVSPDECRVILGHVSGHLGHGSEYVWSPVPNSVSGQGLLTLCVLPSDVNVLPSPCRETINLNDYPAFTNAISNITSKWLFSSKSCRFSLWLDNAMSRLNHDPGDTIELVEPLHWSLEKIRLAVLRKTHTAWKFYQPELKSQRGSQKDTGSAKSSMVNQDALKNLKGLHEASGDFRLTRRPKENLG